MPIELAQTKKRRPAYSFAEKKRVVELYESGLGSKRIARVMSLDDSLIRLWLRRYRAEGLESLRPYWRVSSADNKPQCIRTVRRVSKERLFSSAFEAYATTREPVSSITRRFGLNYNNFVYHVRRFHPELVAMRDSLFQSVPGSAAPGTGNGLKAVNEG